MVSYINCLDFSQFLYLTFNADEIITQSKCSPFIVLYTGCPYESASCSVLNITNSSDPSANLSIIPETSQLYPRIRCDFSKSVFSITTRNPLSIIGVLAEEKQKRVFHNLVAMWSKLCNLQGAAKFQVWTKIRRVLWKVGPPPFYTRHVLIYIQIHAPTISFLIMGWTHY